MSDKTPIDKIDYVTIDVVIDDITIQIKYPAYTIGNRLALERSLVGIVRKICGIEQSNR